MKRCLEWCIKSHDDPMPYAIKIGFPAVGLGVILGLVLGFTEIGASNG